LHEFKTSIVIFIWSL